MQSARSQDVLDVAPHCPAVEKKSVGFALYDRRILLMTKNGFMWWLILGILKTF